MWDRYAKKRFNLSNNFRNMVLKTCNRLKYFYKNMNKSSLATRLSNNIVILFKFLKFVYTNEAYKDQN